MNNINLKESVIFFICYSASLLITIFLGLARVSFGGLIIYSIFFGILEFITILLISGYINIFLFIINTYLAYCLTSVFVIIRDKAIVKLEVIFKVSFSQFLLLLGLVILLSFISFVVICVNRFFTRKQQNP